MGDMANGTDVNGCLSRDNLWGERCHVPHIQIDILHRQVRLGA